MLTTRASPQRGATQVLRVIVTTEGITFRCEDEGKVCQSSVYFPGGFFATFSAPPARRTFSVHLPTLLDALRVFAALPSVTVRATQCVSKAVCFECSVFRKQNLLHCNLLALCFHHGPQWVRATHSC